MEVKMRKSHVVRVPGIIWDAIVEESTQNSYKTPHSYAIELLWRSLGTKSTHTASHNVGKSIKKSKTEYEVNLLLRVFDSSENTFSWVSEKENKDVFFLRLNMLRDAGIRLDYMDNMAQLVSDIVVRDTDTPDMTVVEDSAETAWRQYDYFQECLTRNEPLSYKTLEDPYLDTIVGRKRGTSS